MPWRTTSPSTGCIGRGLHVQARTHGVPWHPPRTRKEAAPADRRCDPLARGAARRARRKTSSAARRRSSARILRERTARRSRRAVAELKEQKRSAGGCGRARAARQRAERSRRHAAASRASCGATIAETLDEILPEAFATVREACAPTGRHDGERHGARSRVEHGAVRRPAHGRHPAPLRQDRRDGDGRRQDARRDAAAVPQRAARPRRASGHGELVPRPPRLAVDGAPVPLPRPDRRLSRRHRAGHVRAQGGVPVRHHVRHEQRVRLRLPARQHGHLARAARAAQPRLRDRRRGRLRAHRRGADAAHHLRARRQRERRAVLRAQRRGVAARAQADGARERARRRRRAAARGGRHRATRRSSSIRRSSATRRTGACSSC